VNGDDAGIVRRCLAGDEKAYRELVERYQAQIHALAMRMVRRTEDAQDLTQETFVRMFRALDRYDPARPFAAWLYTIATRLCIDHIRRNRAKLMPLVRREIGSDEEQTIELEDPGPRPDDLAARSEEEQRTAALVDSLPPHYRIVVVLRHQQDLSYEEIAEALHLPLGTVKARIHRARALLKERMTPPESQP
jgi:RNA polymerase sigma-70 factor (ECF subfamily)